MDNPTAELTQEDDIELGDELDYDKSPHDLNKKVIDAKLILDNAPGKGYYSSRIGIDIFFLLNNDYTMVFEIMWSDSNVDKRTVSLNGLSSIETVHNVSKRMFDDYAKLMIQFNKSSSLGNNYIYIDIHIKMKSGVSYPAKLQTYIVIYGVAGLQSSVSPDVYDNAWTIGDGKIIMNEKIDMDNKAIIGLKSGLNDYEAVNLKQLKSYVHALDVKLFNLIKANEILVNQKQNTSYYYQLFGKYYFDCLDPNKFTIRLSGSSYVVSAVNTKFETNDFKHDLDFFNIRDGLFILLELLLSTTFLSMT